MYKQILTTFAFIFSSINLYSQNIDLDNYEIYIKDTLISKSDLMILWINYTPKTNTANRRLSKCGDK